MALASLAVRSSPLLERTVAGWLAQFRCDALPLPEPHTRTRTYRRLRAGPDCDAWIIRWPPGSVASLHDHGAATGAIGVLCGDLMETFLLRGQLHRRYLRAGRIVKLPADHVHEVTNHTSAVAYSVHVYAPGLEAMNFYQTEGDGSLRRVHSEDVEQWEAASQSW